MIVLLWNVPSRRLTLTAVVTKLMHVLVVVGALVVSLLVVVTMTELVEVVVDDVVGMTGMMSVVGFVNAGSQATYVSQEFPEQTPTYLGSQQWHMLLARNNYQGL